MQYCYVIVQSDGISHDLWPDWPTYQSLDEAEDAATVWQSRKTLPQLLADGWKPVRETPMGSGGRDGAYVLVLLEKA